MSRSTLSVVRLLKELRQVTDWHMLGLYLEIPPQELNKIRQQFLSDGVERCKAELFDLWLRRNPNASWDNVASALEQAGEAALASDVRTKCLSSDSPLPTDPATDGEVKEAPLTLEMKKAAVKTFTKLESKFAVLVSNMKSALEEKVNPGKLHSFLEERLDQTIEYCQTTKITDLFKCISPYYCFLNTTLLENIIDEFIGEPLQCQLDEYERQLEDFISSTEIVLLEMINSKRQPITEGVPLVILKLTNCWLEVTIKRFQEMVDRIFGIHSTVLSNIRVKGGCICITWTTRESAIPSLVALAQEKVEFMRLVGVLKLTVGETVILEQMSEQQEEDDEEDLNLMRAATAGCSAAVEFLLDAGANPNCRGENGHTPLALATMKGSQDTVKVLLKVNADPNLINNNGQTPLMLACSRGHEPIVNLLLQSGADPNIQTSLGWTALLCASENDHHLGIVRSLLAAGAAVNAQDRKGRSALVKACYKGCSKVVKLLLQYNADVQLSTSHDSTVLMFACMNGSTDIVEQLLLVSSANINAQHSGDKRTALMLACDHRHEQIVTLLLNSQADPNLQDQQGYTALMVASYRQLARTVELLLASGADPSIQNKSGVTALMCSCTIKASPYPDQSIPVLLLSAGADPNACYKNGTTALMAAVWSGYESGVRVLLNAQASVNTQDRLGDTALHFSAGFGHLTITDLLLSAGADTSLVNEAGDTAVDIALSSDHQEVCQLLLMHTETKPHAPPETTRVERPEPIHQMEQLHLQRNIRTPPPISSSLPQLRMALRHPLPPAGTIKHEELDEEDEDPIKHVQPTQ